MGLPYLLFITQPAPSPDDDELLQKLRQRLSDLLVSLRTGAEGSGTQ
jgi:hypothetical protein